MIDRELDQDLVPEWRAKYLNYKVRLSLKLVLHTANNMSNSDWQEEGQSDFKSIGQSESDASDSNVSWP